MHIIILSFVNEMNRVLSQASLVQIGISSTVICSTVYLLSVVR